MVQLVDPARCVWLILACGLTIKVDIIGNGANLLI